MLLSLTLINFVIIKEANINFSKGLTVFTGETGAGKSIILDAISILLGEKANSSQIKKGEKSAKITALFNIENLFELKEYLLEQNLLNTDFNEFLLSKIININGKNKSFINTNLVTVDQLKKISKYLINVHGQNNHFSLNSESKQRNILDTYCNSLTLIKNVKKSFLELKNAKEKLVKAKLNNENTKIIYENLLYKKDELESIAFKENEWEEISNKYKILSKSSEIISLISKIQNYVNNELPKIIKLNKELSSLDVVDNLFFNSIDILNSIENEFSEISTNMRNILAKIEIDHKELEFIENRIKEILFLSKKYNISPENIKDKLQEIEKDINNMNDQLDIEKLQNNIKNLEKKYYLYAKELTNIRYKKAEILSNNITSIIKQLALNNIIFKIDLINTKETVYGLENVSFKIENENGSFPLNKIASGGELSRISLAIEVSISKYTNIPTIIFDEVDTGLGGKTAIIIGEFLKKLSTNLQVIVITHLPQIASKGDYHFLVEKNDNQVTTYVSLLNKSQRIEEISKMLGATTITPAVREHAQSLLNE